MGYDSCSCELCDLKNLFYSRLGKKDVEYFCTSKIEKEFSKGEFIIREGSRITDFIYLKSGLVKLFRTDKNQKEQIITISKPFDYVSILSIFSDDQYNYSVVALEESVTCSLSIHHIKDLVRTNGHYAIGLMEKMSEVSDRIIQELLDIRKKQVKGRVAHVLIYFQEEIYKSEEFELPLSRKEIGDYIGMTAENVIRTLSEFRKDKILSINGKTIEIKDLETLKSISQFG